MSGCAQGGPHAFLRPDPPGPWSHTAQTQEAMAHRRVGDAGGKEAEKTPVASQGRGQLDWV